MFLKKTKYNIRLKLHLGVTLIFLILIYSSCINKDKKEMSLWLGNIIPEAANWKEIETLEASFDQAYFGKGDDSTIVKGKIYKKYPNLWRTEIYSPQDIAGLIISDGKKSWNYMKKFNLVLVSDTKKNRKKIEEHYGMDKNELNFNNPRYLGDSTINSEKVVIIEGDYIISSIQNKTPPIRRRVLIGRNDGIVRQIESYDQHGNLEMKITYSNIRTNVFIDNDKFKFIPPEGIAVQSLSD